MQKKTDRASAKKSNRSGNAKGNTRRRVNEVALTGTVLKGKAARGQVRHQAWKSIVVEPLNPLLGLQYVVGGNVMLARVLLKKGCVVPEHSHPNEQITFIADGALKFWIENREIVVNAGEMLTIPPKVPHRALALKDTVDFDIFSPPRADWINKTNSYLR